MDKIAVNSDAVSETQTDSDHVFHELDKARPRMTKAEAEAASYLIDRHIPELFNFLIGHLVATRPIDPIGYLFDLLDKCTLFRSGLIEPPLLFAPRHIESIFETLDPAGLGYISLDQYAAGMKTLGIKRFDPCPMKCRCTPGRVDKKTFEKEAKRYLSSMLMEMIAKPCEC